tara:strand:+ start:297 stop:1199 length:903 start_codon:yes stop_codon:yes gene_type:complete
MTHQNPLLALGRLDGRLTHSPARKAWSIRARFEGAANVACNAGVPTDANAIEGWVAGAGNPPRICQGLNDPIGVAAIVYFFFVSLDTVTSGGDREAKRLLRNLLDVETEVSTWSGADLVQFGPLWRAMSKVAEEPGLEPSIAALGERLAQMSKLVTRSADHAELVATLPGGRTITFNREYPRAWMVAAMIPVLLRRSGLSANLLPSLVPRCKFLCSSAAEWSELLTQSLSDQASFAGRTLERMESEMAQLRVRYERTSRSRLAEVAELRLALPSLTRRKLAIAVNSTPAGAGYLLRELDR